MTFRTISMTRLHFFQHVQFFTCNPIRFRAMPAGDTCATVMA